MGFEKIARQVTYRATCDHCGKTEDIIAQSSERFEEGVVPPPWYGFITPAAYYGSGEDTVVCGEDCAVALVTDKVKELLATRAPGEAVAA